MNKRTFVISELMQNNFIEETEQKVLLEETEESGKSLLKVQLPNAQKIFCIKNVDKKHTDMYFFKADQKYSMMKRVDHIILEYMEFAFDRDEIKCGGTKMDRGQGKISCKLSRFTGDCSYARNTFRSYIFIYYL